MNASIEFYLPGRDDRFEVNGRIEDTIEVPALLEVMPLRIEDVPAADRERCDAVTGLILPVDGLIELLLHKEKSEVDPHR